MANTFSQITIQIFFTLKCRNAMITHDFREEMHKFIGGIIRNQRQKVLAINSVPDHLHLQIGQTPDIELFGQLSKYYMRILSLYQQTSAFKT